jgi:hypothetical protein
MLYAGIVGMAVVGIAGMESVGSIVGNVSGIRPLGLITCGIVGNTVNVGIS